MPDPSGFSGTISYKKGGDFEAVFNFEDGKQIGLLGETLDRGKTLEINEAAFYGTTADGLEMGKDDLGVRNIVQIRNSVKSWAKDQGYSRVRMTGTRVENSSSKNPGMNLDWEADLTYP